MTHTASIVITFLAAVGMTQSNDQCHSFKDDDTEKYAHALIQGMQNKYQAYHHELAPPVVIPDALAVGPPTPASDLLRATAPQPASQLTKPTPSPPQMSFPVQIQSPQQVATVTAQTPTPTLAPVPVVSVLKPFLPASNCPSNPWIDDMVRADPDGHGKVFVDVGCNTGSDAVMWLERWSNAAGVARKWDEGLKKNGIRGGACGQNAFHDISHFALKNQNSSHGPKVVCVEPMPSTAKLLLNLKTEFFGKDGSFEVVQAVASDQMTNQTIPFPDQAPGTEDTGIGHLGGGGNAVAQVPVTQLTVDELFAQHGFKSVDVLTIDTEGHDPTVLEGAGKSLQNGMVRFLVFEVHQDLVNTAWAKTPLHVVLQKLNAWQYDCYFAGNDGKLHRLSGVWNAQMESQYHPLGWSNVACVRKTDVWHAVLEKYSVNLV